ncbi:MAG: hypothetical protein WCC99_21240, partial [Candidatus Sulfotelmatobacter sp.]
MQPESPAKMKIAALTSEIDGIHFVNSLYLGQGALVSGEARAGHARRKQQPGNGDMEKAPHFPRPHPSDGYVRNVQVRKTGQVTSKAPFDLLTSAGHVVVPVHERALRVIAPGPDVELEEGRDVEAIRGA